jgi:hypothetical protein
MKVPKRGELITINRLEVTVGNKIIHNIKFRKAIIDICKASKKNEAVYFGYINYKNITGVNLIYALSSAKIEPEYIDVKLYDAHLECYPKLAFGAKIPDISDAGSNYFEFEGHLITRTNDPIADVNQTIAKYEDEGYEAVLIPSDDNESKTCNISWASYTNVQESVIKSYQVLDSGFTKLELVNNTKITVALTDYQLMCLKTLMDCDASIKAVYALSLNKTNVKFITLT